MYERTVNVSDLQRLEQGTKIEVSFSLRNEFNQSFENGIVGLSLITAKTTFARSFAEPRENTTYYGIIDTGLVPPVQSYTLYIEVARRGYIAQRFELVKQIFVDNPDIGYRPPNLAMTVTFLSTLGMFVLTSLLLFLKYRKLEG
ncbi:MAG TPA: hypothetical protein VJ044_08505 [Candidatus Hodarchaeales archaeon]|nr:hypothetical protein [Candidatus Hodarchaeales archaeon]